MQSHILDGTVIIQDDSSDTHDPPQAQTMTPPPPIRLLQHMIDACGSATAATGWRKPGCVDFRGSFIEVQQALSFQSELSTSNESIARAVCAKQARSM